MAKDDSFIIAVSDYGETDKTIQQISEDIALLVKEAQSLGGNILLLGCLTIQADIVELKEQLQALSDQTHMYIVLGLCGKEGRAGDSCMVIIPAGYAKCFCSSRDLSPSLQSYPFTTWFDSPWGRIAVMTGESIVFQPEIQRYYAASGIILLLNPCRMHRRNNKKTGLSYEHHKRNLAAIVDRDQVYIASANAAPQRSLSFARSTGSDKTVLAPIPFKGSCTSELLQYQSTGTISIASVELSISSDCFTSDFFRPELYYEWYKQVKDTPTNFTGESIKIAVSNFATDWGNKQENLQKIIEQTIQASQSGCNLIVFPEMALTGYSFIETFEHKCMQHRLAETIPGPSTKTLAEIAKEHQIYIILGMPEKDQRKNDIYYNSAAIISPDGKIQSYRKIHPVGDETRWCVPGNQPCILDTPWGRIGISICFDTYFCVEMTRYYAAAGVQLLLNPTASMKGVPQGRWLWYYTSRLESIAYRDKMLIASANILGKDGLSIHKGFQGGSSIHGYVDGRHKNYAGAFTNKSSGIISSEAIDLRMFSSAGNEVKLDLYCELYKQLCDHVLI